MVVSAPVAAAIGVLLAAAAPDGGVPTGPLPPLPAPSLLAPRPSLRATPEETYKLREAKDGTGDLVYEAGAYSARVARDGSVTFKDKSISDFKWFPFLPKKTTLGVPSLESTIKGVLRGEGPPRPPELDRGVGGPPPETTTLIPDVTRYRPDPREGCRHCPTLTPMLISGAGRFDLTDELMRLNGQDPHRFQKAKFLAATRELRVQMAAKMHAHNIQHAAAGLPSRLRSIACDERLSLRERRAILEALRSEMDAHTPEGREAAAKIAEFVSARFDADGGSACPAP